MRFHAVSTAHHVECAISYRLKRLVKAPIQKLSITLVTFSRSGVIHSPSIDVGHVGQFGTKEIGKLPKISQTFSFGGENKGY